MRADMSLTVLLLAIFGTGAVMALALPWEAAIAPLLAMGSGTVLALILLVQQLANPEERGPRLADWISHEDRKALLWCLGAVLVVVLLGFKWGGALYVFAYLTWVAHAPLWARALSALAVPAVVILAFEIALQSRAFPGLLLGGY